MTFLLKGAFFILVGGSLFAGCKGSKNNQPGKDNDVVLHMDFENNELGEFTATALKEDAGHLKWFILDGRGQIEDEGNHGKVLKVSYPKGSVGPSQGGVQYDRPLPPAKKYYLDYHLKFLIGFDFRLGGKLPGLTSGGEKYTGGIHPENGEGWSARYMWKKSGDMIVYFYYMDMPGKWGEAIELNTRLQTGKWYRITQFISLNDEDQFNGVMQVWINGEKVLNKNDIRYRIAPKGLIDSFYFSTFHGGNSPDWAPLNDSYALFDDIEVTVVRPSGLD